MAKKPIKITEVVLRDAHQSLIATRMTMDEMRPILPAIDEVGYYSVECWGGATFDSCIRFLDEDPWDRLRILRKEMPNTKLQMLFRGQNMLGYRHYADDAVEYFVQKSVANGIDILRMFDALNDPRNLETAIRAAAAQCGAAQLPAGITIHPTTETVDMCDDPSTVFRRKKDTSMGAALTLLRDGAGDAAVSAGSTGALLTGATLITKRIHGIRRAAMAPVIPTTTGSAVLIDCGANAECTPEYLLQFAYLGNFYAQRVLNVARPRVGLLNIGAEDSKGTDLQKQTLALLREADSRGDLHFIGNIEAKDAIKGGCDVIVTDGFSGNVMLKTIEGVGSFAGSALKTMFKKNLLTKLAALLVMPGLNAFKARLDPNKVGGTAFIGISRPVIKAHGGSNAEAIENAVGQAIQVAQSGITEAIAEHIDKMQLPTA